MLIRRQALSIVSTEQFRRVERFVLRLALVGYLAMAACYTLLWLSLAWQDRLWLHDYLAFYSAGQIVLAGLGGQVYDMGTLMQFQQAPLVGLLTIGKPINFVNPPQTALLMVPLASVPHPTSYLIWTALQLGMLAWTMRLAGRRSRDWPGGERRLAVVATVALPLVFLSLLLGAYSLLMLLCLWSVYIALRRQQMWQAGVWLAVGLMVKPQLLVPLGVMLLTARHWRTLTTAAGIGLSSCLLVTLVCGWSIWPAWVQALIHNQHRGEDAARMFNIGGSLTLLFGDLGWLFDLSVLSSLAMALAAIAWLWRRRVEPGTAAFDANFALTVILGLVTNLHLNAPDAILAVLPLWLMYDLYRRRAAFNRWLPTLLLLTPLLVLASQLGLSGLLRLQLPVICLVVLGVWLARARKRLPTTVVV